MDEATQWLTQWPIWALVALLVSAVFYASRLTQRVGGLEQGLATLTTRMETLFAELRDELRTISRDQAAVRERVSALEAREG